MISMATYYVIVKNGGIPTYIHISQQQLILEYLTCYQISPETYHYHHYHIHFKACFSLSWVQLVLQVFL